MTEFVLTTRSDCEVEFRVEAESEEDAMAAIEQDEFVDSDVTGVNSVVVVRGVATG